MNIHYKSIYDFDKLEDLSIDIATLKRHNDKIKKNKTIIKSLSGFLIVCLVILMIYFYYSKNLLTIILVTSILIALYVLITALLIKEISNTKQKKPKENYVINLPEDSYWDKLINNYDISPQTKYMNFETNNKIIVINNDQSVTVLTSEFMINILSENVEIISGNEYVKNMKKIEYTALEEDVSKYKYKEFSYKRWRFQRKDGGPDRRYKDNFLYNYYTYKIFSFNGLRTNVPDFSICDYFKKKFNYKMVKINSYLFPELHRINSINFKSFESIISFLNEKQMVYNFYGLELDVKINDKVLNIKEKDLKSEHYIEKLRKMFGGLFYDE